MSNGGPGGGILCQRCGKRPATVRIGQIVNGQKSERFLCESCAQEEGSFPWVLPPPITVQHVLGGLVAHPAPSRGPTCPVCGFAYPQFASTGRLGCPACYQSFREGLAPLIRRVQAGSGHHGKVPARTGGALRKKRELEELQAALQTAVAREEFERAAELRDRIRALERAQAPGEKGAGDHGGQV